MLRRSGLHTHVRILTVALAALLVSLSAPLPASDLVLTGARVYPSPNDPLIENVTIIVHDGRIVAVGPGARVKAPRLARAGAAVNCRGMVVTAGFWNSHIHFTSDGFRENVWKNSAAAGAAVLEQQMQRTLTRWGFTTVFDTTSFLANTNALRTRVNSSEVPGPRIFTVGEPLFPKDASMSVPLGTCRNPPLPRTHAEWRRNASLTARMALRCMRARS